MVKRHACGIGSTRMGDVSIKHRIEEDNDWGVEGEHTHKSQTPRLSGGDNRQAGVDQCERPVGGPPKAR